MRILLFILDSLLYMINCFILIINLCKEKIHPHKMAGIGGNTIRTIENGTTQIYLMKG